MSSAPPTLTTMSPHMSLPSSQAGCKGKIFLILTNPAHGPSSRPSPPPMLNPSPSEFFCSLTSKVLEESNRSGTRTSHSLDWCAGQPNWLLLLSSPPPVPPPPPRGPKLTLCGREDMFRMTRIKFGG